MSGLRFASKAAAASSNAAPVWLSLLRGISWAFMFPYLARNLWDITGQPDVPASALRRHFVHLI